jgi:hypothetical protein
MNALLDSICKAGLNRARIHDALANIDEYDGVTGHMVFDPNQKNVAPLYLGTVHNGTISYRVATMEKASPETPALPATSTTPVAPQVPPQAMLASPQATPAPPQVAYARVGEEGVTYAGPHRADGTGPVRVILFGAHAREVAQSAEMQAALKAGAGKGSKWTLLPVDSDQNWGAASTQLVHALMDEHALAIVALDRDAAHLSEQLALKTFVPVVALSSDKTLTSTNVPWIFRLPATTTAASAISLLQAAEVRSGENSERLRDALASGTAVDGVAFLTTGEPRERD